MTEAGETFSDTEAMNGVDALDDDRHLCFSLERV